MSSPRVEDLLNPDLYQVFLMQCPATLPFSFACHTWFIVNRKGTIYRYGVGWRKAPIPKIFCMHDCVAAGCREHFHKDIRTVEIFPGFKFPAWRESVVEYVQGDENSIAKRMADFIIENSDNYPYINRYVLTGPNSNTYPAWVLEHFPKSGLKLPWNAVGGGYHIQYAEH